MTTPKPRTKRKERVGYEYSYSHAPSSKKGEMRTIRYKRKKGSKNDWERDYGYKGT